MPLGSAAMVSAGQASSGRFHGRSSRPGSTVAEVMFNDPLILSTSLTVKKRSSPSPGGAMGSTSNHCATCSR